MHKQKPRSGNPNPYQAWDKRLKHRIIAPRREYWLVRQALKRLGLRYWQQVLIWNPGYTGLRRRVNGGRQWIDFVLKTPFGMGALIFNPTYSNSRPHLFEKRALQEKKDFLDSKHIPYLILPRRYSLDEYDAAITFWLRKETHKHEKQLSTTNTGS